MTSSTCNIALFGQKFMGRAHSNAYLKACKFFHVPLEPFMHTIVGLDLIALAPFANRWNWRKYSTSWKDVVKDPAINLIDICTPTYVHAEQAVTAIQAGKHVACEKPFATTLKEARMMRNAAIRSRKSKTFVWYNYRRCPAVATAYQMVHEGRLGQIHHIRANFLQDWAGPEMSMTWRFQKKYAGSGAHGDLNSHLVDLTRFITGHEIVEVSGAVAETFIVERDIIQPPTKTGGRSERKQVRKATGKCDVDDCLLFFARTNAGAIASFEASRAANGHKADLSLEINGVNGALRLSLEDMNALWFYDQAENKRFRGWRRIVCTQPGEHPYAAAWWPEGNGIGYEHTYVNMVAEMMAVLAGEQPIIPLPDFADAYETQRVLEAAGLAARHRSAVKLTEIK
jgi:predicted dehydrogenase